jgi:hypothetical protein
MPGLERETFNPVTQTEQQKYPLIAVVGPCASGKSLLVQALRARGYNTREVAQEHSYVPTMWQRITQPDLLVYLDVSWAVARQRRPTNAGASTSTPTPYRPSRSLTGRWLSWRCCGFRPLRV